MPETLEELWLSGNRLQTLPAGWAPQDPGTGRLRVGATAGGVAVLLLACLALLLIFCSLLAAQERMTQTCCMGHPAADSIRLPSLPPSL